MPRLIRSCQLIPQGWPRDRAFAAFCVNAQAQLMSAEVAEAWRIKDLR